MIKTYVLKEDALKAASDECMEFRGIYGRIEDAFNALPTIEIESGLDSEAVKERLPHFANG